jgi:type II secretory pathway pseudopilin PulG
MTYQELEQAVEDLQTTIDDISNQLNQSVNSDTDLSRVGQFDFPLDDETTQILNQAIDSSFLALSGSATLVAGTVTVSNPYVYPTSTIIVSRKTSGGTLGYISITSQGTGTFTVGSSSATDTSVINYLIIN